MYPYLVSVSAPIIFCPGDHVRSLAIGDINHSEGVLIIAEAYLLVMVFAIWPNVNNTFRIVRVAVVRIAPTKLRAHRLTYINHVQTTLNMQRVT